MPNIVKKEIIAELERRYGALRCLPSSKSLFVIGNDAARIYFRYSKVHEKRRAFFGLRATDLQQLETHDGFLCFLFDDDSDPIVIPYSDFEAAFEASAPASDGQYKIQILFTENAKELYIARQGRFNLEGYVGLDKLEERINKDRLRAHRDLTHPQVQTLLSGIGNLKGHRVWVPANNLSNLDWSLTPQFQISRQLPSGFERVLSILQEVDVIWFSKGGNQINGLFEVEHSTPIYSGLLRFNDLLLTSSKLNRFSIVCNETRRDLFIRQVRRPTFSHSGLSELASFLEYSNVFDWHERLIHGG